MAAPDFSGDVELFGSAAELRARFGRSTGGASRGLSGASSWASGAASWLESPPTGAGASLRVGGAAASGSRALGWSAGSAPQWVERWVFADGLPLRTRPESTASTLALLDRNERVFVTNTAAVPRSSPSAIFVEVQTADRSPVLTGWMPLHWLSVGTTHDSSGQVNLSLRYGLLGRQLSDVISGAFYSGCNKYPDIPHDSRVAWQGPPALSNPGSIPYARRYDCGELPVGDVVSASWKSVRDETINVPPVDLPGLQIVPGSLTIPVQHSRLPQQTRGSYSVQELNAAQPFNSAAPTRTHESYRVHPDHALLDDYVRVHDTDAWYKVSWTPPASAPHAVGDAFVNVCFQLPGGQIRGAPIPTDIHIDGLVSESRVTGIDWGRVEYSSFNLCATVSIRDVRHLGTRGLDYLHAEQNPFRVEVLNASLRGLDIWVRDTPDVSGNFAPLHYNVALGLESFLHNLLTHDAVPLLFDLFMRYRLEDLAVDLLSDFATRLEAALPDPDAPLDGACDLLPGAWSTAASSFYPLYLHCREAAQAASTSVFTNTALERQQLCYSPGARARAFDGKLWDDDEHDEVEMEYEHAQTGLNVPVTMPRPFWLGCGPRFSAQTTAMGGYWPLLSCMGKVADDAVNYQWSTARTNEEMEGVCTTPAAGLLCQVYGDGEDLDAMWTARYGVSPNLGGIFGYCAWYEELTRPDDDGYGFQSN